MSYYVKGNDIYLQQKDFDLEQTLDCGQAFRWEKTKEGFCGTAFNKKLFIEDKKDCFVFKNTKDSDFCDIWVDYFDLKTDYLLFKEEYSEDETLRKACTFAWGIRLLKQESFEALCSFIISQNNNIPRIKGIIGRLCEMFGGFPSAEELSGATVEDLAPLRAGFRAKYLVDCAKKVADGEINLKEIKNIPIEDARGELKKIMGVGPKVAECGLLYGMYRIEAFPIDVWIKKVLNKYYPQGFPEKYDKTKGIAQQYLFHYIRKGIN